MLLDLNSTGRCEFQVCVLHCIVFTAARPKLLQEDVGSRSVYSTSLSPLLLNLSSFRKVWVPGLCTPLPLSPLLLNLSSFRKVWVPGLCTPLQCLHCCSTSTPSGRCGFQVCVLHYIVSTATRPKLLQEGVGSRSVYSTPLSPLLLNLTPS